jgi:DNA modification methylase
MQAGADVTLRIMVGDAGERLRELPDESVHCVVTSPPYFGLRNYGVVGQIGLEPSPAEYVETLVEVFREVRRVMRKDGTLWLNLGDSYASTPPGNKTRGVSGASTLNGINGSSGQYRETLAGGHATKRDTSKIAGIKPKDLLGIPWMVAFALRADGWWLRQDIVWSKPNPMPESVTDRCTKAHEYLFLLSKSERYWFDAAAIAETAVGPAGGNIKPTKGAGQDLMRTRNGLHLAQERAREVGGFEYRNKRSVWTVTTQPYAEAHFATFPPALVDPCILAGCPKGGTVLDPFGGAGTTALVADRLGRDAILIELNPAYAEMARRRISDDMPPLFATEVA